MAREPLTLHIQPSADADIDEQVLYLAEHAGESIARRFLAAVEHTCERIALFPGLGKRAELQQQRLRDVRWASVIGFRNHLIYYSSTNTEVSVLRVLHAARDRSDLHRFL